MTARELAASGALDSQAGLTFRLSEIGFHPMSVMLTDCRSLFDHVYAMTGSIAEMLIPDIHEIREATMPWRSAISEDYSDSHVELWWCDTFRQLADNLTKLVTPSTVDFFQVISSGVITLGGPGLVPGGRTTSGDSKTFERPRPSQRAHAFWHEIRDFLVTWNREDKQKESFMVHPE